MQWTGTWKPSQISSTWWIYYDLFLIIDNVKVITLKKVLSVWLAHKLMSYLLSLILFSLSDLIYKTNRIIKCLLRWTLAHGSWCGHRIWWRRCWAAKAKPFVSSLRKRLYLYPFLLTYHVVNVHICILCGITVWN